MAKLNKNQMAVVMSNAQRICVLAGAGTGKTETMTQRIIKLVKDGVAPESILVLTFTNAGAVNMEERFIRYTGKSKNTPKFSTFHAFCYQLICADKAVRNAIGYIRSTPPVIVDDSYIKAIRLRLKTDMGLDDISDAKIESGDYPLSLSEVVDDFKEALNKEIVRSNKITFDMISEMVSNLFVIEHESIMKHIYKYDYIFVDEFQDTDETQFNFLMTFDKYNKKLLVVGDPLQNLYSFRGTSADMIKGLADDTARWTTYRLDENYRSTEEICNFANNVSVYGGDYRVNLKGHGHGDDVTEFRENDPDWICTYIQKHHSKNANDTTAVICRTNKEVKKLVEQFKAIGVEVQTKSDVHNIENILSCIKDAEYAARWISASIMSNKTLLEWTYENKNKTAEERLEILRNNIYAYEIFEQIETIKAWIEKMGFSLDDENGIIEAYQSGETTDGHMIYVGTIHSVKGLEYDCVYVYGVGSKQFRLNDEDNWNCYYVAVTRAKKDLVIFKG